MPQFLVLSQPHPQKYTKNVFNAILRNNNITTSKKLRHLDILDNFTRK